MGEKLTFFVFLIYLSFLFSLSALGGLLSAYHFSEDKMFLDKAEDLGKRLMKFVLFLFLLPFFA